MVLLRETDTPGSGTVRKWAAACVLHECTQHPRWGGQPYVCDDILQAPSNRSTGRDLKPEHCTHTQPSARNCNAMPVPLQRLMGRPACALLLFCTDPPGACLGPAIAPHMSAATDKICMCPYASRTGLSAHLTTRSTHWKHNSSQQR